MRNLTSFCLSLAVAAFITGCGPAAGGGSEPTASSAAPEQRLAELAKEGPVFLYFAKATCGSNPRAAPLVQAVYKPYEGKVKMLAVVNTPDSAYDSWRQQYGLTMPGVADVDMSLVNHFGFEASQHIVKVEKGGKASEIEGGFGRPALEALNKELAAAAGMEAAPLALADAPASTTYG
ncbi:MAG: redoxin domain-containing protein [Fimbriimonadaceae bacterium]